MKNKRTIIVLALVLLVILGLALYLILGNGSKKENTAPTLANPNNSSATANIQQGQSYKLDLAALFTDEEDAEMLMTSALIHLPAVSKLDRVRVEFS